ncbi:hypothetical protein [Actinoplanes aureus]|uniref:hypothetical protein n=1 Tax=Actinoplanes aureus TaxID=2792083 RepID=UPI001E428887|nr:hypothetical protein [Actinoplanes aureus]
MIAPAAPCRTRATISTDRFGATAARTGPGRQRRQHADQDAAFADHVAEAAQVVLSAALGIVLLRASGLQPLAAAEPTQLAEPLRKMIGALLS